MYKSERTISAVLNGARMKYISRKLKGSINISATFGPTASSINCDICDDDFKSEVQENLSSVQVEDVQGDNLDGQISYTSRLALASIDKMIQLLEWRAMCYENTKFKDSLTLSRSITIAPPFPIVLFSLSLYCTANINDLIISAKSRQSEKLLLKESKEMNKQIVKELESKGYKKKDIEHAIQLMEDAHVSIHTESVIQQINTNKNSKNTK